MKIKLRHAWYKKETADYPAPCGATKEIEAWLQILLILPKEKWFSLGPYIRFHYGKHCAWHFRILEFTPLWSYAGCYFGFTTEKVKQWGGVKRYESVKE